MFFSFKTDCFQSKNEDIFYEINKITTVPLNLKIKDEVVIKGYPHRMR